MADSTGLEKEVKAMTVQDSNPSTQSSSLAASLREKQTGPMRTPFVDPTPSSKPNPTPELTAEQESKYEALLETVKAWSEVPSTQDKAGPLTEDEIMWLSRECLLRYLRATKWNTSDAAKRLLGTLTWRREYIGDKLTGDYVSPENETGKQVLLGFDAAARPCLYLRPGQQNTQPSPRQNQHLVFMLERALDLMIPGQEGLALLINFKAGEKRSNTSPRLSQGKEVLNILQTHYPERLGRACIINVPWIVWGFFKLITPFIDPLTREKLKFNEDVRLYVPAEQLWTEYKGDAEFEYNHDVYWPALLKLCEEKQAEKKARWIAGGKKFGEDENYLKGEGPVRVAPQGDEKAQGGTAAVAAETKVQPTTAQANGDTNVAAQVDEKQIGVESSNAQPEIVNPPVQSNGVQANGNTDIAAQAADPKLTTEGDRA